MLMFQSMGQSCRESQSLIGRARVELIRNLLLWLAHSLGLNFAVSMFSGSPWYPC